MKHSLFSFSFLLVFLFPRCMGAENTVERTGVTITGAFALYPIAVKWAEEFKKVRPSIRIDISAGGAGKGMTDVLTGLADIGMLSRDINPEETKKGAYGIAVTRDAVVPTISEKNPLLNDLLKKGIKKDALMNIWITGAVKTWGQVTGTEKKIPIHVYTRSDASGASETWAKYLGGKQEDLLGTGVFADPGVASAVQKDRAAIGYNNLVYVYDAKTKTQSNGIRVLPIDLNNNGTIDAEENFYNTLDNLGQAISGGKYPSPPARELFFVTKGKPQRKEVLEFIRFILTDGQRYVHEAGYINLSNEMLEGELNKIR